MVEGIVLRENNTMFHSARITLTAWYLLIIMTISIIFSTAFYYVATSEIERIINRLEYRRVFPDLDMPFRVPRSLISNTYNLEELEHAKQQLLTTLVIINGAILFIAGGGGYFLAGRTLKPIEEMVEEQRQFITDSSHEIRTPIATLRAEMESNLMEKHISDKKARTLIKSNLEELDTLQNLANDLLKIAQLHGIQKVFPTEIFTLHELFKLVNKKTQLLAKQKHIDLVYSIKNASIQGNKKNLTELFVIFIDNAIKYSPEHTTITVSTYTKKDQAIVTIKDQGIGIHKEDLPFIFNRFYRADKSRSQAEGYGLGLSIAKKIVELHNGSITVRNNIKTGTIFIVTLPLKKNPNNTIKQ